VITARPRFPAHVNISYMRRWSASSPA